MSRPLNRARGARIALDTAQAMILQPSLFGDVLPLDFWQAIEAAANDELDDVAAYRAAMTLGDCGDSGAHCDASESVSVR